MREFGVRGCDGDGGGAHGRFVYEEARTRGSWEEAKMRVRLDSAAVAAVGNEEELDKRAAAFMQDLIFSTLSPH